MILSRRQNLRHRLIPIVAVLIAGLMPVFSSADEVMSENIEIQPDAGWRFFTDGVMGGVSEGKASFVLEDGSYYARIEGQVSTENNGGFIQLRLDLPASPPASVVGVRLVARGNNQRYFVHLRTTGTMLPWQYYQASFDVTDAWTVIRLPLEDFKASGALLRAKPRPDRVTSVAVAAFGRDHSARIDVKEIGFY